MPNKVATVLGATGAQGSAAIAALLKYPEYHIRANFDGKGEANAFIAAELPALPAKTTFLMVGWYDSNFGFPAYRPAWVAPADKYVIVGDYPADAPVPVIGDVRVNLVPFVRAVVEQPQRTRAGAVVMAYQEMLGFETMLKTWAASQGKEAVYVRTSKDTIRALWREGAWQVNMLQWMALFKEGVWGYDHSEVLDAGKLGIEDGAFVKVSESFKRLKY
ncbi:hypothetical protein F4778DRAFT_786322 [Xylariomycetidae sp. FL2044]|nr:hypothetical protein F4778DRAFT_786322 [Xylariomycetidae sp. FL2044]